MKRPYISARVQLTLALSLSSLTSAGLYAGNVLRGHEGAFGYLLWNLILAWLALLIALWLERTLQRSLWSGWYALFLTSLWLVFLPNTFYMVSDLVHIPEMSGPDALYGIVMFASFIFNGMILGYLSLYIVHWQLLLRLSSRTASLLIGLVLLACSFAIYIGRELRWNTWDIVANPFSLIVDVSDRLINPHAHPQAFTTTFSFFVLLGSVYIVLCSIGRVARNQHER